MIFDCCCGGSFFVMNSPSSIPDFLRLPSCDSSLLRSHYVSHNIKTHSDFSSFFDVFPVFRPHSLDFEYATFDDVPDLMKDAYGIDVYSHPFFSPAPPPFVNWTSSVNPTVVNFSDDYSYQFLPALFLLLLGSRNPAKTGKVLRFQNKNQSLIVPHLDSAFTLLLYLVVVPLLLLIIHLILREVLILLVLLTFLILATMN